MLSDPHDIRVSATGSTPMLINGRHSVSLDLAGLRDYLRRLRAALNLKKCHFVICLVDDREIARLNSAYRQKAGPTDVLSFPWTGPKDGNRGSHRVAGRSDEFADYLGDIVISAETARRNARAERRSTQTEISWLMLHGLLHLLGHDHETDDGEMIALEHSLRRRLTAARRESFTRKRAALGRKRERNISSSPSLTSSFV